MKTTVTVFFEDGDFFTTGINLSFEEARRYYEGNIFNVGLGPEDNLKKCTHIELYNEKANMIRILAKKYFKKSISFLLEEIGCTKGLEIKADVEEELSMDDRSFLTNEILTSNKEIIENVYWKENSLCLVFR